jgi:bacteriocin biosynthesis cyclodehydratase domain-containing protein
MLRLRPSLAVIPTDNGCVQLRDGDTHIHVLKTHPPELASRVLSLLDGTRDASDICDALGIEHATLIQDLLEHLSREGCLANDDDRARVALAAARVSIHGHTPSKRLALALLAEYGVATEEAASGSPGTVHMCVVEQPDLSVMTAVNAAVCAEKQACLFVDASHGGYATVGPFFIPNESACYVCFRRRLHENTKAYAELVSAEQHMLATRAPLPGPHLPPASRHFVIGVAVAEVVAFLTRQRPLRTRNRALTLDLEGARIETEPVLRVPWCKTCKT